jgi:hypothetical protein
MLNILVCAGSGAPNGEACAAELAKFDAGVAGCEPKPKLVAAQPPKLNPPAEGGLAAAPKL